MRKPRVIVTSGDPGGVGPELILRALADPEVGGLAEFTVVGSPASFRRDAEALGLPMPSILPAGGSQLSRRNVTFFLEASLSQRRLSAGP